MTRVRIRKIWSYGRGGRSIVRKHSQRPRFFERKIGQHNIVIHLQGLDSVVKKFFDIFIGKKSFAHDYLRKPPSSAAILVAEDGDKSGL